MDYKSIKESENKPVRIFLKDNKTFYFGTYVVSGVDTISFTDRKRRAFPIDMDSIGVIEPVDKIIYEERENG